MNKPPDMTDAVMAMTGISAALVIIVLIANGFAEPPRPGVQAQAGPPVLQGPGIDPDRPMTSTVTPGQYGSAPRLTGPLHGQSAAVREDALPAASPWSRKQAVKEFRARRAEQGRQRPAAMRPKVFHGGAMTSSVVSQNDLRLTRVVPRGASGDSRMMQSLQADTFRNDYADDYPRSGFTP
jgi:hypothetical protein